uniref:Large ribosomal subunit protein uL29m n=1 Tax=Callorhinchus milii TaxID=7868 RepID=A0A4W3GQE1_CALMI
DKIPHISAESLHTSHSYKALHEFFDDPKNWGESTVKSGAPWSREQLRLKSNEDLHKLWYVLLKEKNMLLTTEQESKRQRVQMPSLERLKKVERSMSRIDLIVDEREGALRLLQTGQEQSVPGSWRKNIFGQTFWHKHTQWPIPWYLNKKYRKRRYYTPTFVNHFIRLRLEQDLREKNREKKRAQEKQKLQEEKFPRLSESAKN